MLGLIIAVVVFLVGYATCGRPEPAFLDSANFLFWWYLVCSLILMGMTLLTVLGAAALTLPRFLGGGWLGVAAAGLTGGALILFLALLALKLALPVIGAWFLSHAGTAMTSFANFDHVRLVVGAVLIAVSFLFRAKSSS